MDCEVKNTTPYLFFCQFTSRDNLLWQGFVKEYDLEPDLESPMDDLRRLPDGKLKRVTKLLGTEKGNLWEHFYDSFVEGSEVTLHLDTSNVVALGKIAWALIYT